MTAVATPPTTAAPAAATRDERPAVVRRRVAVLAALALVAVLVYQFAMVTGSWSYAMDLRLRQVGALVVVGVATGVATLLFQTVATSRILTPGVMGYDSLFVLVQTLLVWVFGSAVVVDLDVRVRFLLDAGVMTAFGLLLFRWVFRRNSRDLFVLVLVGVVLGTLFTSLTLFASRLLSPSDYLTLQDLTFASFNTVDPRLLSITAAITVVAIAAAVPLLRRLDVVALGHDTAVTLGVDYHRVVNQTLAVVTVLVAASTALVGPLVFVGLIVANIARQVLPTYRHRTLALGAALAGVIVTVGGQFVASRLLDFTTTLTVCVNLVGGLYFVWLLLREVSP